MNRAAFPQASGPLLLQGGAGAIEAHVEWPVPEFARDAVAVVCHPHSLHGGSMGNKVVTTCERALRELGCATLRFNFRGVGRSAGEFDDGLGEGADLLALCDWVRVTRPTAKLVLAGFSFGAYVSMTRAAAIAPQQLISIAPPVGRFDLHAFQHPPCPWLVLQPDADEVVDAQQVYAWVQRQQPAPTLVRFADASHFFHGRLPELRAAIQAGVVALLPPLA
ncbi:MAG: alpha/beta hydrolase [Xanthomonadales bacterium]|nr:alpha/beta hydrolase [Xanthomonadales bacterium]